MARYITTFALVLFSIPNIVFADLKLPDAGQTKYYKSHIPYTDHSYINPSLMIRKSTLAIPESSMAVGYFLLKNQKENLDTLNKKELTGSELEKIRSAYGKMPLRFIENRGQVDKKVRFYAKSGSSTIWFTNNEIVFDSVRLKNRAESAKEDNVAKEDSLSPLGNFGNGVWLEKNTPEKSEYERHVLRMKIKESNANPVIAGQGSLQGTVNFLIGKDPQNWKTGIPAYGEVYYQDIYDGIDLRFYTADSGRMQYDYIVHPGADPANIVVAFEAVNGMEVTQNSDLLIKTTFGDILQKAPVIYQIIDGEKKRIAGMFKIHNDDIVANGSSKYGFSLASYDKNYPLVIDPEVVYSSYLGGSSDDRGDGIALDSSGNAFVTGSTLSFDFPTVNAQDPNLSGSEDAFVVKINAMGSEVIYSTYLGGSGYEYVNGIAVDNSGNTYLTGGTNSGNFPTVNALYPNLSGSDDAFVSKINASGSQPIYSTYIGGGSYEHGTGIAVDIAGNAYVTGLTMSGGFPTINAPYPNHIGDYDAFVSKINASGSQLIYSTYIGGSGADYGYGIAVDSSGNAYVTGITYSGDFPTVNAPCPNHITSVPTFN